MLPVGLGRTTTARRKKAVPLREADDAVLRRRAHTLRAVLITPVGMECAAPYQSLVADHLRLFRRRELIEGLAECLACGQLLRNPQRAVGFSGARWAVENCLALAPESGIHARAPFV